MDVLLVDDGNILCTAIITLKNLNIILLDLSCLLNNTFILICQRLTKKSFPLAIRELIIIEDFKAFTQVCNQIRFLMYLKILIPQSALAIFPGQ